VPVLISDNTALPLEGKIAYHEFVVRVPESDVDNLEHYLQCGNAEEMSRKARATFIEYFSAGKLERFLRLTTPQVAFL
jgi:hypothetical protein